MKKLDQKGFGLVEGLLILVTLALVIGGGYYIYTKRNEKKAEQATPQANTSEQADTEAATTWTAGDFAVKGKFADADVVKISDNKWRMYYATQPEVQGNNLEVYSATSTDGKTWTEESGTRKTMATFPDVVVLSNGHYRMYFQNAGVIKSAVSTDGLNFTDEAGERMTTANPDNLTFDNVAAPSVSKLDDGTFVMVYRGTINERYAQNTPNPTTQILMWATSADGVSFTSKGIAIDSRTEQLDGQIDGPDMVKWDDNKQHVFMTSYTGVYESIFDGSKFATPTLAFADQAKETNMGFQGAPPGDPAMAKINDTWFMYYGATGTDSGIHYATLQ